MSKMMTWTKQAAALALLMLGNGLLAQPDRGPYDIKTSQEFSIPRKHHDLLTLDYGPTGTLQIYNRGTRSFGFWLFDNNLKIKKQQVISTKELFKGHHRVGYNEFLDLRTKSYLLVREVFRETATEGISAVQFSPESVSFTGSLRNLYQSTDKVIGGEETAIVSADRSKFMCYYTLRHEERDNSINKEVMGFHVFDENLNKLWGGEYEMPYTEAMMSVADRMLTNDGRFILLAKVYDSEKFKEVNNGRPNYHYELMTYAGANKKPMIMRINFDTYFVNQSEIYEDPDRKLVVTGFFSKTPNGYTEGTYMVKIGTGSETPTPYYYEIPNEVIKAYTSSRDQERLDRQASKGREIGVPNLKFRKTFFSEDHTSIVLAEQYNVVMNTYYNGRTTYYTYDTYADDIYIMKFDSVGQVIWVNKIGKSQHSSDAYGVMLSFSALQADGSVNVFFIDNLKNLNLTVNEYPYTHQQGRGGYFTGVNIDGRGYMKRYNLGEMANFDTGFNIRYFDTGNHNNLLGSGRRGSSGFVYSIEVK